MPNSMKGRVAAVTGAGNGLGREYALQLAREGACVVVNDLGGSVLGQGGDHCAADAVVDEIRAAGGQATAHYESIATAEGAQGLVDQAVEAFGRIDALVHNAGILRDRSFAKMTADDFEQVLRVHLFGGFHCAKAAWPRMQEQKFGRLVMTHSSAGSSGNFGQANYAAAKMGLLGLMNTLAVEGARYGIRVNAISPGAATRMTQMAGADAVDGGAMRHMAPAHVAPAVVWLCSEACDVTAHTLFAAAGGFGRMHMFETPGVQFDPSQPVTLEMFTGALAQINDLSTAVPAVLGDPGGSITRRLKSIGIDV